MSTEVNKPQPTAKEVELNAVTLDFINHNLGVYRAWVGSEEQLQQSHDLIKPLLPDFKHENPTHNLQSNCKECVLDVVRWAIAKHNKHARGKA